MIEASAEAKRLALAAKHFGVSPYDLKNLGLEDPATGLLPPCPRPDSVRAFMYAAAEWLEEREYLMWKGQMEVLGAKLPE